MSRCVRRAFLLGEGKLDRKEWIENRIKELAEIFAVGIGGFSVMDNHLHLLVRLDPDVANGWSDEEVVRRWGRLFPPRDKSRQPLPVSEDWVQGRLKDVQWVATTRGRLQNISWFMKCLKEPLSRLANREDKARGAFFEGRFKSVAILDEEALLAICAYIDLNPVAAGIAEVPETSKYTSIKQRVGTRRGPGRDRQARSGQGWQRGRFACGRRCGGIAVALPDRGSAWAGFVTGRHVRGVLARGAISSGRLHRAALSRGKGRDIGGAGRRSLSGWGAVPRAGNSGMEKLRKGQLFGRFFAASRERLRDLAAR